MIDFFSQESCTETARNSRIFGLTDKNDSKNVAFSTDDTTLDWTATVINNNENVVQFTGIDHNKYFYELINKNDKKCDGMLFYKNNKNEAIIFVELKTGLNSVKWVFGAKCQLLNTIKKFKTCHEIESFNRKEAYASNSFDITGKCRQNDIEEFLETGFDFYVKSEIEM